MSESIDAAGADWSALRRRFAGEALANVLAFCGWQAETRARAGEDTGPCGALALKLEGGPRQLSVGPVTLLWGGVPLAGRSAPHWPRYVAPGAARFFLTARPLAEPAGLDCELASRLDGGSPCYFTRYTHKRLCALLSRRWPEGFSALDGFARADARALALTIGRFPAAVRRAAEALDPYFVNRYAVELTGVVWRFLHTCPLAEENRRLAQAAEVTLGNALDILNLKEESQ